MSIYCAQLALLLGLFYPNGASVYDEEGVAELMAAILDIYAGNKSSGLVNITAKSADLALSDLPARNSTWPYLLLGLWISSICFVICSCLYCKCAQENSPHSVTTYNSNSFELQEVQVLGPYDHPSPCDCLFCLQRQVARELELRNEP